MMRYGTPIMVAGIAFAINEQFDKILLSKLLPADIAEAEVGVYSACYKLGLFMVLYRTAYTLGIEPFFSAILMIKCTANLRDGNKILCHLWIIYIIVGNCFC
jgi:O-antigen/teichoic acid export membrane protein